MLFRTRSLCYLVSASCRVGVTRYMDMDMDMDMEMEPS